MLRGVKNWTLNVSFFSPTDAGVEFVLTREILWLPIRRAELHLQLSNPQHLDVHPLILFRAKRNFSTR